MDSLKCQVSSFPVCCCLTWVMESCWTLNGIFKQNRFIVIHITVFDLCVLCSFRFNLMFNTAKLNHILIDIFVLTGLFHSLTVYSQSNKVQFHFLKEIVLVYLFIIILGLVLMSTMVVIALLGVVHPIHMHCKHCMESLTQNTHLIHYNTLLSWWQYNHKETLTWETIKMVSKLYL